MSVVFHAEHCPSNSKAKKIHVVIQGSTRKNTARRKANRSTSAVLKFRRFYALYRLRAGFVACSRLAGKELAESPLTADAKVVFIGFRLLSDQRVFFS